MGGAERKMKSESKTGPKRKYKKPTVRVVHLAAKEVLAVGCKLASGGGGYGDACHMIGTCIGDTGS